jgi:acetate---CoA ligase (ADP-forming)
VSRARRDLRPLFNPASVAVVGASANPAKWGHLLARGALAGEERRRVFLVNRNGGRILGRESYPTLAELPEPPELVVVAVPAEGFEPAVDEALAVGARAIVGISAGLGAGLERAVAERVRAAGAVLLGPNCLGVSDSTSGLMLAWSEFRPGQVGVIAQSGNLALEIALLAADAGLGISRFASLGNQADLEAVDLLEEFAQHDPTRVVVLYIEDFRDGREFARAAGEAGKPVVLLAGGLSEAAAHAARSHTGALVSELVAVEAACRAAGIFRVSTPKELVDLAAGLEAGRFLRGRRLAVVADGGGHGVVAAGVAAGFGFELPVLSDALQTRVAAALPPTAATRNPVDFAGGGEQDVTSFEQVTRALLGSDEVDAVLLTGYFGGYGAVSEELGRGEADAALGMANAAAESGRPLFVHTMYWQAPAAVELRRAGVPVYREVEAAVATLARLATHAESARRPIPALPTPERPSRAGDGYWGARELVAAAGIALAEARRVQTLEEALAAAGDVGYPVVLKALGRTHKSDGGGVILGIEDETGLRSAFAKVTPAPECSVEHMAPMGVELIVGVRRDARFGQITLVGVGGIYAELVCDVAVALAPIDEAEAEELFRSLRAAPLLLGARGRPPLDLAAAARAAAGLSRLAAAHPELDEIEVNPLLVTADGALALDARVVRGDSA